jgi:hypothetical protein
MKQLDWVDELKLEEEQMEAVEEYRSSIGRAIAYWSNGQHIPLTLYTELLEDGYDVPRLEARHLVID